MISNLLMGAAFKMGANVINTWMANKADEHRANMLKDADIVKAHIELAKENNKDLFTKISRSVIFFMLTGTFCYMGLFVLHNYADFQEGLIPVKPGLISKLFSHTEYKAVGSGWNIIFFQFFQIMEMVIGFFVVPSRRR